MANPVRHPSGLLLPRYASPLPDKPLKSKGKRVIKFIENYCVLTNGRWVGKPFKLLPWQKQYIMRLFATEPNPKYPDESDIEWIRQYRWSLLGIPKKNGKSEMAAALALYFLIADGEPSPLVVIGAASDEQANLVYGAAKKMCELSPALNPITECYDKEILVKGVPGAKLMRVAAVAGTNDGLNIHAAVLDELHEWTGSKGRNVHTVLTNGTAAREQPMILQITTAGWDMTSICYEHYDRGTMMASGEMVDDRYLFWWYEGDPNAPYNVEESWEAANPSWGHILNPAHYESELTKKTEGEFRRYYLNNWTAAQELWLPGGLWESLAEPDLELTEGPETYVAIDASTRYDSTAIVWAQWTDDNVFAAKSQAWERPTHPATGKPVEDWTLDFNEVEQFIRDLHKQYNVVSIGYDPQFLTWVAQHLDNEGLPMEEIPQTNPRMVPATQHLYQLITQGQIVHDGDPVLARHLSNVVVKAASGGDGGVRIAKGKSKRKIDAAVALAMCVWLAFQPQEKPKKASIWTWSDESNAAISA